MHCFFLNFPHCFNGGGTLKYNLEEVSLYLEDKNRSLKLRRPLDLKLKQFVDNVMIPRPLLQLLWFLPTGMSD